MKKIISLLILAVALASFSSAFVSRLYVTETDSHSAGIAAIIANKGEKTMRDARITAYIPYVEAIGRSGEFTVSQGKSHRPILSLEMPKHEPGYYPVVVLLSDDSSFRRAHSWVYID